MYSLYKTGPSWSEIQTKPIIIPIFRLFKALNRNRALDISYVFIIKTIRRGPVWYLYRPIWSIDINTVWINLIICTKSCTLIKTYFCTFYLDWSYITCDIIYDWGHHFVVSKWRTGDDCNLFETVYKLESKVYCSFIALHNNVRLNNPDLWFPHLLNLYDQNDQTDSNNQSHIYPEQLHFRMVSTPEFMKLQDEIPINDGQIW